MKSSPSLVAAAAGAALLGACSNVGRHVSLPESAPNSARLVVEMTSPPPFDFASGEKRQSFSASFAWITGRCTAIVKQVTGAGSEQKETDVRIAPVCPRGVETG